MRGYEADFVPEELVEFRYRERLGLTYWEFLEEPFDRFRINMEIINLEGKAAKEAAKKAKRNG